MKKHLMKALLATTLVTGLAGCESDEERAARLEREAQQRAVAAQIYKAELENQFANLEGLATYNMPIIEVTSQKSSFTLDLWEHAKNSMKAQTMTFPVSETYFSQVQIGDELDSTFNLGGLLFDGEFSSYSTEISDKFRETLYCALEGNNCLPLEQQRYQELLALNDGSMQQIGPNAWSRTEQAPALTDDCAVTIQSTKSNFTLDLAKHISNAMNELEYELTMPRVLCDGLEAGSVIDDKFVGESLFFSRSPSSVEYRVTDITKNYE